MPAEEVFRSIVGRNSTHPDVLQNRLGLSIKEGAYSSISRTYRSARAGVSNCGSSSECANTTLGGDEVDELRLVNCEVVTE